jgi:hypothetical protein
MRAQQFLDWLKDTHKCENIVIEGRNVTGFSIKILCKNTGRYYYFSGPFGHVDMDDDDIKDVCDELWISYPTGIN